jgi:hypothetical protein
MARDGKFSLRVLRNTEAELGKSLGRTGLAVISAETENTHASA